MKKTNIILPLLAISSFAAAIAPTLSSCSQRKWIAKSIKVQNKPTKTSFNIGEKFDSTGLKIIGKNDSGEERDITSECETNPKNGVTFKDSKSTTITVTHKPTGLTTTFDISILTIYDSISVTGPDKKEYEQGQTLDLTGLKVYAQVKDSITQEILVKDEIFAHYTTNPTTSDKLTPDMTKVDVLYVDDVKTSGHTLKAKFDITVTPKLYDIRIDGEHKIDIDSETKYKFKASRNGEVVTTGFTWQIKDQPAGISISNDGTLTLGDTIKETGGSFVVQAVPTDGTKTAQFEIEVASWGKIWLNEDHEVYSKHGKEYRSQLTGTLVIPSRWFDEFDAAANIYSIASETPGSDGLGAFEGCGYTKIKVSENISRFPARAFAECPQLSRINVCKNVSTIDATTFLKDSKLTNIDVDSQNTHFKAEAGCIYNNDKTKIISWPAAAGAITIPNTVTSIGDNAFFENALITGVSIPEGLTEIGKNAFYCSIDSGAGEPKGKLATLNIPKSVTTIGDCAFIGQSNLTLTVDANNTKYSAVQDTGKSGTMLVSNGTNIVWGGNVNGKVSFPTTIKTMSNYAFAQNTNLTEVTIPFGQDITNYAFAECRKLANVVFSKNAQEQYQISTIGEYAFYNCGTLNSVVVPTSATSTTIKQYAFCKSGITEFVIPDTVTLIEKCAFDKCGSLGAVYFADKTEKGEGYLPPYWVNNSSLTDQVKYWKGRPSILAQSFKGVDTGEGETKTQTELYTYGIIHKTTI